MPGFDEDYNQYIGETDAEATIREIDRVLGPSDSQQLEGFGAQLSVGLTEIPLKLVSGAIESVTADPVDLLGDVLSFAGAESAGESLDEAAKVTREFVAGVTGGTPKTMLGNFAKEVGSFTTLFLPFLGLTKLAAGGAAATRAGVVGQDIVAGAMADFLMTDTPDKENTLRERLHAVKVGAAVGGSFDGIVRFLRSARNARLARLADETTPAAQNRRIALKELSGDDVLAVAEPEVRITGNAFSLDDPTLVRLEKAPLDSTKRAATRETFAAGRATKAINDATREVQAILGPNAHPDQVRALAELRGSSISTNWDHIRTEEDVKRLFEDTTQLFADSVNKARRGVVKDEALFAEAAGVDLTIKDVLNRRVGQPLSDVETIAFRKIHAEAGAMVRGLMDEVYVKGDLATNADILRFNRGLSIFHAVNKEAMGARAEAGRTLRAWGLDVAGDQVDIRRGRMLMDLIESRGGRGLTLKMVKRLKAASDAGALTDGALERFAQRGVLARSSDALNEALVMSFLWEPSTHVVNLMSNSLVAGADIAERGAAEIIGRVTGESGVAAGETWAMYEGTKAGLRFLRQHGLKDLDKTLDHSFAGRTKIDVRPHSISSKEWMGEAAAEEMPGLARVVDWYGHVLRTPGRVLEKGDALFKTVGFQAELHAQAWRRAVRAGGDVKAEYARLIAQPDESLKLASVDAALYRTFQNKSSGYFMRLARAARDGAGPVGTYFLPFVRTPINIMHYTFERTPLAALMPDVRRAIRAGGASQQIALARVAVGSATALSMADLAWEGLIKGDVPGEDDPFITAGGGLPKERGLREAYLRSGYQADSIQIGSFNIRLSRLDPLGMYLALAGTMARVGKDFYVDPSEEADVTDFAAALTAATIDGMRNKTWFAGLSQAMSAIEDFDQFGIRLLQRVPATLAAAPLGPIPELFDPESPVSAGMEFFSERVLGVEMGFDEKAQAMGALEGLQERLGFLQTRLTRRRDLWGRPQTAEPQNWIIPTDSRIPEMEPIDRAMIENHINKERIPKKTSFEGASVDFRDHGRVYEAYVRLAGNELKLPLLSDGKSRGTLDTLNLIVSGNGGAFSQLWGAFPRYAPAREALVQQFINNFRTAARTEIMENTQRFSEPEFDRFREEVRRKQQIRAGANLK